ncbi:cupin domain-containing protein [Paralcaligenes ureilyticus]|uniref:(S)-ureidoglycine aminohydrolase cupin domain-containing protein n=1 Tax=Paralcaligenes ureilyticus TaxID=627131 RepID=A0A4R3M925_9BURK|nr:cupin domain-containing protein [Paralcaligenes ureilyticus]TCT09666.1 hypothetical protein EDC26_103285 [Paralcaligenes ureilyticus]
MENTAMDVHGIRFGDETVPPSEVRAPANTLVRGNPLKRSWQYLDVSDLGVYSGIWTCEPGAYEINQAENKVEVFHILEGQIAMVAKDGHRVEFKPGDTGVIPQGFRGVLDVMESARKLYVVTQKI